MALQRRSRWQSTTTFLLLTSSVSDTVENFIGDGSAINIKLTEELFKLTSEVKNTIKTLLKKPTDVEEISGLSPRLYGPSRNSKSPEWQYLFNLNSNQKDVHIAICTLVQKGRCCASCASSRKISLARSHHHRGLLCARDLTLHDMSASGQNIVRGNGHP